MDAVAPIPQSAGEAMLGEVIAEAQRLLEQAGIESAGQEAFWIVEHMLRLPAHHVVADRDRLLSPAELLAVKRLIERRVGREPLQYILGTQEFCGLEFAVNAAVLIPRPETELLVEYVAQRIPVEQQTTIVDVCTGSGCIAVAIARLRPRARVIATDLSNPSLDVARQNATRHAVCERITWLEGDLLGHWRGRSWKGALTSSSRTLPILRRLIGRRFSRKCGCLNREVLWWQVPRGRSCTNGYYRKPVDTWLPAAH